MELNVKEKGQNVQGYVSVIIVDNGYSCLKSVSQRLKEALESNIFGDHDQEVGLLKNL